MVAATTFEHNAKKKKIFCAFLNALELSFRGTRKNVKNPEPDGTGTGTKKAPPPKGGRGLDLPGIPSSLLGFTYLVPSIADGLPFGGSDREHKAAIVGELATVV